MGQPANITLDDFSGGTNRATSPVNLQPNELFEANGVFQKRRGELWSCYEAGTEQISFPNSALTTANGIVPLRLIYWAQDSSLWQLYGQNAAGTTSVRRQDLDREYASYAATGVVYNGELLICGANQQAFLLNATYHNSTGTNAVVTFTDGIYDNVSGGCASMVWGAGYGATNVLAGDYFVGGGGRYQIQSVSGAGFTLAAGLGLSTIAGYIERVRPVYLGAGAGYGEDNTVSVTAGSTTVDCTSTASISANQYVTFYSGASRYTTANRENRSYKVASVTTGTRFELADAYEGSTTTVSMRVATTALLIALPFIYKDRLFAVGSDATAQDYNTLYWAGYPGDATNSIADDVFDVMYWATDKAAYPIGLASGAIQRAIGLKDRVLVFCQNAVYELRGTPPVDASKADELQDRCLNPESNTGLQSYDAVDIGPDGQTAFFGSPDGLFRVVGSEIEAIDQKIRDHECYTGGVQFVAYYDNRMYFTDATDDYTRGHNSYENSSFTRKQFAWIWILDLVNGSWTSTQRVKAHNTVFPLTPPTLLWCIANPYRGDLTQTEKLFVGKSEGLTTLNDPALEYTADTYTPHNDTIITAHVKTSIKGLKIPRGCTTTDVYGGANIVFPAESRIDGYNDSARDISGNSAGVFTNLETGRYRVNGPGGRGTPHLPVCIGHWTDLRQAGNEFSGFRTISGTTAWNDTSNYLVIPYLGVSARTITHLEWCFKITTGTGFGVTFYILDSSRNVVMSASPYGFDVYGTQAFNVTNDYFWWSAPIASPASLDSTATYYAALKLSGGAIELPKVATGETLYYIASLGGALVQTSTGNGWLHRAVHAVGQGGLTGLQQIDIDFIPVPERRNR